VVTSALKKQKTSLQADGPYMDADASPAKQTSASSYSQQKSIVKRTMSANVDVTTTQPVVKTQYKSKLAANQMESIVNNIRSRLS